MNEPAQAPFSEDSEKAFLSSLIQHPELINRCDTLSTGIFFIPAHQTVFRMLVSQRESNQPIEFVLCKAWLKKENLLEEIGGIEYLNNLWTFVPTAANWEYYLDILKENHIRRKTIQCCQSLMQRMYDPAYGADVSIRENVEATLTGIVTEVRPKNKEWSDVVDEALAYLEKPISNGMEGVLFNIEPLDLELSGIRRGEYCVICAEVSVGKTALSNQGALNTAMNGKTVAMFSYEMSALRMALRSISQLGSIRMSVMRTRLFSERERTALLKTADYLKTLPIKMEDAFTLNINALVSRCRQIHAKEALELVVVDYVQLVPPATGKKNDNREREVADISRKLKNMAGELNVAVIGLSQLNEFGKMRESRALSQDPDIILRVDAIEGSETARTITIDKNRDGPRGKKFPVTFEGQYVTFTDAPVEHSATVTPKKNGKYPYQNNAPRTKERNEA